jgi:3-phosphoshikimate 1-carboxyvinyltransferase
MIESVYNLPTLYPITVPGDKSMSHRSVLFSSLAKGSSEITGFLEAEDPINTMKSFAKIGVTFEKIADGHYRVFSPGKGSLWSSPEILDFGNGGTGVRLSAGLLSGLCNTNFVLTGDASLRKRPMKRILDPLQKMGADITSINSDDRIPLKICGKQLKDFSYTSKLSSAQVKSCLMLAAISSDVSLDYDEPELSRNHTENILSFLGGNIQHLSETHFIIRPPYQLSGASFKVPGDISSAAFFIVLGLISKQGSLSIKNIGLNPARIGILTVLREMGGKITIDNLREECGEPVGDIQVFPSHLKKVNIPSAIIPSIIDEIPILTIAGLFSEGGFSISHAEDLRAKESDRIHSMVVNLRNLGLDVEEKTDGYAFGEVNEIRAAQVQSFMDHRIAMSFYIAKTVLNKDITIDDDSWIDTSFPTFKNLLFQ